MRSNESNIKLRCEADDIKIWFEQRSFSRMCQYVFIVLGQPLLLLFLYFVSIIGLITHTGSSWVCGWFEHKISNAVKMAGNLCEPNVDNAEFGLWYLDWCYRTAQSEAYREIQQLRMLLLASKDQSTISQALCFCRAVCLFEWMNKYLLNRIQFKPLFGAVAMTMPMPILMANITQLGPIKMSR